MISRYYTNRYANNTNWPPRGWEDVYSLYDQHAAWYSSDPLQISRAFAGKAGSFWGKAVFEERRAMLHVPTPADISQTSASCLFAEHPRIRIPDAFEEDADQDAKDAQSRLEEILDGANVYNVLSEAAESASALGGVFLKIGWGQDLASHPLLLVAQADCALPEFKFGILTGVTFWRVLETEDDGTTWRLLEKHQPGVILSELWCGDANYLGKPVDLINRTDTAEIPPAVSTGLPGLACRYIPNRRPNRQFRHLYLGRSDYAGLEGVFDSIDEAWSSWMRDIRLGLGRIIAPASFFEKDADTGTMGFDLMREAYMALNAPLGGSGAKDEITINQFAIRAEEHYQTITALLTRAYQSAGYSPQTFGLEISGQAESGTALTIREHKTVQTTATKADYWSGPVADLLEMMLSVDASEFRSGVRPYRPTVEMQDGVRNDMNAVAQSVELISRARAASTDTLVRMLHPDWESETIAAEVERINTETGVSVDPMQIGVV